MTIQRRYAVHLSNRNLMQKCFSMDFHLNSLHLPQSAITFYCRIDLDNVDAWINLQNKSL